MSNFKSKVTSLYVLADEVKVNYPYFHVTNFPGTPSVHNIYLGIKGEKYSTSSYDWIGKKYLWNARLNPNIKLYKPDEDWDLGEFESAASRIGFEESYMTASKDSDISFYQELIEEKFGSLDLLVDNRPQYGFHILKAFSENGFFNFFRLKGYQGIYDTEGKYLYEGADLTKEPQILIFNPKDIIWGSRDNNDLATFKSKVTM
jgi:hypothetical protein